MTTYVRDMNIGNRYSFNGKILGILCEKRIIYNSENTNSLYKIVFQQNNSKVGLIKSWDDEFLYIKNLPVNHQREEKEADHHKRDRVN